MGILEPLPALIISFAILAIMLYRRINLGITLTATAILLALLSLNPMDIPHVIAVTSTDPVTLAVVLATFGIMLLSQLYGETGFIKRLSESLSRVIKNPKIVLSLMPAILGFLPVAGGALMSAPLVDSEAEKLKLDSTKKAYLNLWFRHTIFPVYPLSQVLIMAAFLTGTTVFAIILRQIPVVITMVIVGFAFSFRRVTKPTIKMEDAHVLSVINSDLKEFLMTFSPIIVSIAVAVAFDFSFPSLSNKGFDVLLAATVGIILLAILAKPARTTLSKPLKSPGIYGITLAAYAAFLLGNVIKSCGVPALFQNVVASGNVDVTLLLIIVPAVLGMLTASALGGVTIAIPILAGIVALTTRSASLIYMSAYLGYVISPTHLCLAFTRDYFSCSMNKMYKYIIPSFLLSFAMVLLVYFFW